jgi:hypothetical protein
VSAPSTPGRAIRDDRALRLSWHLCTAQWHVPSVHPPHVVLTVLSGGAMRSRAAPSRSTATTTGIAAAAAAAATATADVAVMGTGLLRCAGAEGAATPSFDGDVDSGGAGAAADELLFVGLVTVSGVTVGVPAVVAGGGTLLEPRRRPEYVAVEPSSQPEPQPRPHWTHRPVPWPYLRPLRVPDGAIGERRAVTASCSRTCSGAPEASQGHWPLTAQACSHHSRGPTKQWSCDTQQRRVTAATDTNDARQQRRETAATRDSSDHIRHDVHGSGE